LGTDSRIHGRCSDGCVPAYRAIGLSDVNHADPESVLEVLLESAFEVAVVRVQGSMFGALEGARLRTRTMEASF